MCCGPIGAFKIGAVFGQAIEEIFDAEDALADVELEV